MFSKKCPYCDSKIKDSFEFCPSCGNNMNSKHDKEDYGLLGKNDFVGESPEFMTLGDKFLEKIFSGATKLLEKQLRSLSDNQNNQNKAPISPNLNVQFFVNGKKMTPQNRQITEDNQHQHNPVPTEILQKFSKSSKLPRKEPKTKLKRIGNKIVYELEVPGVNDIRDILINQLESSIEIKALAEKTVYHKTINLNLPVTRYQLIDGNLFVELGNKSSAKPL